jgi:peptidoglycan/xylan/chitin deacetylase (PgdA/CDA1 family)
VKTSDLLKKLGLGVCVSLGYFLKKAGTPVLVYHSIDDSRSYLSLSKEMFARQMAFLNQTGWKVISLEQFLNIDTFCNSDTRRVVVLTFDDGLDNFYNAAWPVLNQYGFSATMFVPTDYIGKHSNWYADYGLTPQSVMGWPELKELHRYGIDIQSHGCSHQILTEFSPDALEDDVKKSKIVLEQGLGKAVDIFCYPNGVYNQQTIDSLRAAGYKAATVVKNSLYQPGDDLYQINRLCLDYIAVDDELTARLGMQACLSGTFGWYVTFKKIIKKSMKSKKDDWNDE